MSLSNAQKNEIEDILKNVLRSKFNNYNPKSSNMPFHLRLLGKDRMALYSFIQSLNTVFGTSIFEPVAKVIAKANFRTVELQKMPENRISSASQEIIQKIVDDLTVASADPDKATEIEKIRAVCNDGDLRAVKKTKIDLYLEKESGEQYFIDIISAKPKQSVFLGYKRMLLDWVGVTLAKDPNAKIHTLLCIPYNPYEPKPYARWTMAGMIDLKEELLVGKEFWDFLGGDGTYEELLDCFEKVGIEMRDEIDANFAKYQFKS